jgi:hypothetical protein
MSPSRCKKNPSNAAIPAVDKPTTIGNESNAMMMIIAPGMSFTVVA